MTSTATIAFAQATVCPVCGNQTYSRVESFGRFAVVRCSACTLEFADPIEYSRQEYDLAYSEPAASEFVVPSLKWLAEASPNLHEARWMLFSAQLEVLRWLKSNRPKASILDVGCGPGWFLARARQLGFEAAGIEVGSAPVKLLQEKGFRVICGSLESIPNEWQPDVVTLFEVLEHLPQPAAFMAQIKKRFPHSTFMLSVPGPQRWTKAGNHRDPADYPPNHLTRWNPQSLHWALKDAGYSRVEVNNSPAIALETTAVSIKATLQSWRNQMPETLPEVMAGTRLRHVKKEILVRKLKYAPGIIAACVFRALGWSGLSIWAVAEP
ncbi:MAG TPA: class I SAM-dependent methyltransferase [Candidatus Angelobacter sp.]|nr:class I SAM-dependent methyltransferase [Candidatus Angelobacter sp.]